MISRNLVDWLADFVANFAVDRVLLRSALIDHITEVNDELDVSLPQFVRCFFPFPLGCVVVFSPQVRVTDKRKLQRLLESILSEEVAQWQGCSR